MRNLVSPGMNHRRDTAHMEMQNTQAAHFSGLDITGYVYSDPSMTNGSTQDVLGMPAAYSTDGGIPQLEEPYSQEGNGQGNPWSVHAMYAEPRASYNRDASHLFELRHAASSGAPAACPGHQPLLFSGALHYNYLDLQEQPPSAQVTHEPLLQGYRESQTAVALTNAPCFTGLQCPQDASQSGISDSPYYQSETPARTFPTPSELLVELAGGNPSADGLHCHSNRNLNDLSRRPRRRTLSRGLGLTSGDSAIRESISSHEKKRQYLECLEHYVMFLHQQLNLVGAEPAPLERVPRYRGLNNRSIRTLLVHMENTTKTLNLRTLREEQRFVDLRDAVYRQDATALQTLQNQKIASAENL